MICLVEPEAFIDYGGRGVKGGSQGRQAGSKGTKEGARAGQ